jgi:nucleotide-binding universal stress UspA family protein
MLKILIPTDGSADSLAAVRHALHLVSKGLHARFVVVNVQDPATLYEMVVAHDPQVLEKIRETAGLDLMREAVDMLRASGQEVECEVATGDPARLLVEILECHQAEAIIMASRGAGGVGAALLGSVASDVLQLSPVPVTLVKPPRADDTE